MATDVIKPHVTVPFDRAARKLDVELFRPSQKAFRVVCIHSYIALMHTGAATVPLACGFA